MAPHLLYLHIRGGFCHPDFSKCLLYFKSMPYHWTVVGKGWGAFYLQEDPSWNHYTWERMKKCRLTTSFYSSGRKKSTLEIVCYCELIWEKLPTSRFLFYQSTQTHEIGKRRITVGQKYRDHYQLKQYWLLLFARPIL